jgi:hypothetical protein
MNDSSSPRPPRPTLKLKVGARKSADGARKSADSGKTPITPQPDKKAKLKPGADWSDEYKRRMQEDMDALVR